MAVVVQPAFRIEVLALEAQRVVDFVFIEAADLAVGAVVDCEVAPNLIPPISDTPHLPESGRFAAQREQTVAVRAYWCNALAY
jgi:hypothetical protein